MKYFILLLEAYTAQEIKTSVC